MKLKLAILSLGINVLALLLPLALLQVYDRILPNQDAGTAAVIFSAVAIALVVSGFLRVVRTRIFSRISAGADYRNWMTVARGLMFADAPPEEARKLLDAPLKARDADAGQSMVALYDTPFVAVFLFLIWFLGGEVVLAPLLAIFAVSLVAILYARRDRSARKDAASQRASWWSSPLKVVHQLG